MNDDNEPVKISESSKLMHNNETEIENVEVGYEDYHKAKEGVQSRSELTIEKYEQTF